MLSVSPQPRTKEKILTSVVRMRRVVTFSQVRSNLGGRVRFRLRVN